MPTAVLRTLVLLLLAWTFPAFALAQSGAARRTNSRPARSTGPVITAIGTFAGGAHNAVKVEASSDGWVLITPLSYREAAESYPAQRVFVTPADARRWVAAVRAALAAVKLRPDTPRTELPLPNLGRGPSHFETYDNERKEFLPHPFRVTGCNLWSTYDLDADALARMADVVEQAARAATAYRKTPRAPTLARPYLASEVGCPARAHAGNPHPAYPELPGDADRRPLDVGVRFVVDTAGRVESGSVATLPGVPTAFVERTREMLRGWRFNPAMWSDRPVRQLVHLVLTFDPSGYAPGTAPVEVFAGRPQPRIQLDPTPDGWVRVTHGEWQPDGSLKGSREWFAPDSLRHWLKLVETRLAEDAVNPKIWRPGSFGYPSFGVGHGMHTFLHAMYPNVIPPTDSFSAPEPLLHLRAHLSGCRGFHFWGERIDSALLERVRQASDAAERLVAPPRPVDRDSIHQRNDVACPAMTEPRQVNDARFPGTQLYSVGPYTDAMRPSNVRAEVMSSFVVDTMGRVEAGSLEVMPGSDERAVAALRAGISAYSFTPAVRSAVRVRQRVVRLWTFVPPPRCETGREGVECQREYERAPSRPAQVPSDPPPSQRRPPVVAPPRPRLRPPVIAPARPWEGTIEIVPATATNSAALRNGTGAIVIGVNLGPQTDLPRRPGAGSLVRLLTEGVGSQRIVVSDTVDDNGIASLRDVKPGEYTLAVGRIGFTPLLLRLRIRAGFIDTVHVALAPAPPSNDHVRKLVPPPCPTPTPRGEELEASVRKALTSGAGSGPARALGVPPGLSDAEIVRDSTAEVCWRATMAVRGFLHLGVQLPNYLVLRARDRYVVLDHLGMSRQLFSMTLRYDDVRMVEQP